MPTTEPEKTGKFHCFNEAPAVSLWGLELSALTKYLQDGAVIF